MFDPDRPAAEIVLDHTECGWVLQRHGIDYCSKGRRPLRELCAEHGVEIDAIAAELEDAIRSGAGPLSPDPRALSTEELIVFLVERHHRYLRSTLPFVSKLAERVNSEHGERNPKLRDLFAVVRVLSESFGPHLDHEEERVFPLLASGTATRDMIHSMLVGMEEEHRSVQSLFDRIRTATDQYQVPEWADTEYATLMRELQVLELDTMRHVHLETHVLMPRFYATP